MARAESTGDRIRSIGGVPGYGLGLREVYVVQLAASRSGWRRLIRA